MATTPKGIVEATSEVIEHWIAPTKVETNIETRSPTPPRVDKGIIYAESERTEAHAHAEGAEAHSHAKRTKTHSHTKRTESHSHSKWTKAHVESRISPGGIAIVYGEVVVDIYVRCCSSGSLLVVVKIHHVLVYIAINLPVSGKVFWIDIFRTEIILRH